MSIALRITDVSDPVISRWETPYRGLEAAFNITNLSLGLAIFFLTRILALMYFINSIENKNIILKSKSVLKVCVFPFLVFFLLFVVLLLTRQGFAVDPITKIVSMEKFKYLHNLLQMPLVLIMFLIGVVGVLAGIFLTLFKESRKGIWYSGIGTIMTVFSVLMLAGFNNTAYYPSTYDLQSSLTIENSSSSKYTLTAMSYVSLLVPFVIAYIWYAWKSINKKRIDEKDIEMDEMKY
jgi:cytochrome d ubiquinol oxidase subunit II